MIAIIEETEGGEVTASPAVEKTETTTSPSTTTASSTTTVENCKVHVSTLQQAFKEEKYCNG